VLAGAREVGRVGTSSATTSSASSRWRWSSSRCVDAELTVAGARAAIDPDDAAGRALDDTGAARGTGSAPCGLGPSPGDR
jgi:hypothetical protein